MSILNNCFIDSNGDVVKVGEKVVIMYGSESTNPLTVIFDNNLGCFILKNNFVTTTLQLEYKIGGRVVKV